MHGNDIYRPQEVNSMGKIQGRYGQKFNYTYIILFACLPFFLPCFFPSFLY